MSRSTVNETFLHEAHDLLEQIEQSALTLERFPDDAEQINLLFRAFHTVKGSGALVGLKELAAFTHHVESTLDKVRAGTLGVDPHLVSIILASKDHIATLLQSAIEGLPPQAAVGDAIIAKLQNLHSSPSAALAAPSAPSMRTMYEIRFRLRKTEAGLTDASSLLEELARLGPTHVEECAAASAEFGPQYKVALTTVADLRAIRDVFIFVEPDTELEIEQGLSEFVTEPPAPPPSAAEARLPAAPEAAQARAESTGKRSARRDDTVRVPSERLDTLVKLVGEIVINQSRLQQAHAQNCRADIGDAVEVMDRLITELRDGVLGIRMMPIGATFRRFERLARDLSTQLGKEIELVTEGDETELDKTVLDQLGDPLVHMIRNSMDHGIETPAERIARGKPAKGRVLLRAAQDGDQVLITIKDDGRGLDKSAVRAKAEERGLIEPGKHLSDQETYELILLPGFSTAKAVTQLSGRGVGMDVVKRTIEALRGTLSITSESGVGTTMRLALPVSLAIIDGLMVEVGGDRFIVPMGAVTENVELTQSDRALERTRNAVAVRGELLPYVRLRDLFGMPGPSPEVEKVVLARHDGQRIGLVVDRVIGIHQTVIRSLGPLYRSVDLFSGTTIMGDGHVAMILELAGIARAAHQLRERATASVANH